MKNYWLHRISHEWEISYPLLEKGYLSYGWNDFSNTDLLEKTKTEGWSYFESFMSKNNITARSRYSLWRFLNLKKGGAVNFNAMSEALLVFAKKWIVESN